MKKTMACLLVMVLVLSAVMSGFGLQGFAQQDDSERLNIIRYSGVNRYDTARMVAMEKYPEGAETVLIVRGG